MIISNWYKDLPYESRATSVKANILPGIAEAEFGDKYGIMQFSCDVSDFDTDKILKFNIDIKSSGCMIDIYAIWYKNGKEVFKEYIEQSYNIKPYKGCDRLVISVLARSQENGRIKILRPSVEYGDKFTARNAVVSSLCIPYGFEWEHKQRECSRNLEDSICAIDRLCKDMKHDLVVLTENFYSRNTCADFASAAIREDGKEIELMRQAAARNKTYLSFSFREVDEEGYYYNSALLIGRSGEIILKYHKTHITTNEKVSGLVPGDGIAVADTDFARVGIAICWDLYYPEFCRLLSKNGAEIIINPSAGFNQEMHRMRARDSGAFIVTAGTYGDSTVIVDPYGEIIANGILTGAATSKINLDERFKVRMLSVHSYSERKNIYLHEMRNDLY